MRRGCSEARWTARAASSGTRTTRASVRAAAPRSHPSALAVAARSAPARASARAAGARSKRVRNKGSRELEVLTWLGVVWPELAYARGATEPVLEAARRSIEIAERLDNEASRIIAYQSLGLAHLVEGQPAAAREAFRESVGMSRSRPAARRPGAARRGRRSAARPGRRAPGSRAPARGSPRGRGSPRAPSIPPDRRTAP